MARGPPADAELVDSFVGGVAAPGLPGEGGQAGQQHRARVYPQEAVVAPRAEHEVAVRLRGLCTVLYCTALHCTALYCIVLCTWRWTWPDWLMMSTPAGASSDMEEVVLSRLREWPAGDRTAFVPRDSLDGDVNLLTQHQVYRLLDGDPGGGGQHDLVRADDGLPGGGGEERLLGGVRHHEAVRGEGEAAPVCNTRPGSTPGTRTSVTHPAAGPCGGSCFCC